MGRLRYAVGRVKAALRSGSERDTGLCWVIVRSSKFLLLFLAAALLGTALFAVVAVWQLSRGPVSLSYLTPFVEDALSGGPDGVRVRLHDTVITWAGLERTLDLHAIGLEILDDDGEVGAVVPELSVQLSLRALMRGLIAPSGLELFGPRLRVVRKPDGDIFLGIGAVSASDPAEAGGMDLIGRLLQDPDPDSATGYLRRVSINSALIEFEDRQTGRNWTAQRADIALARDENGIQADGTIVLNVGGGAARFEISGRLNAVTQSVELGISFEDLSPTVVASVDPKFELLDRLMLPVSGTLAVSLSASLTVEDINFDLTGGAGEILAPEFYKKPLPVTQLRLRGRATEVFAKFVIDEASIDVGGPIATLSGEGTRQDRSLDIKLDARAEAVPANRLAKLWPAKVGVNARAWITKNIKDGVVDVATLSTTATISLDDLEKFKLGKATGDIDIRGATIHYLRPMPPVRKVSGKGRFDGVNLVFDLRGGALGELKVESGTVAINGLTGKSPVETVRIEGNIAGPVRDALVLLDQDPLNLISPFGIDPAQTSGTQITNVVFGFPLLNSLTVEQVDIAASARLQNIVAPAGVTEANISQGNFDLTVDTKTLVAKGEGALSGIPVNVTWTENFTDETKLRTRYEVKTVLDDSGRETFGLAAAPYLLGPVGTELTYEIATDGAERGVARLNLTDATLTLEEFGWRKPPGQQATAILEIAGRGGVISEISKIAITAPGLSADGRATLTNGSDGQALSELELTRLVLGESDVSLRVAFGDDGVPDVVIGGEKLDLRMQIREAFGDGDDQPPALRVRIDDLNPVRSIRLGEETALQNPRGRIAHDGENWTSIDLKGSLSNAGQVDLQLRTVDGQREISIESDDGGGLLRALDWVKTVEGGALKVVGTFINSDGNETLSGQITLEDFKLNESSVAVRLLSLVSFSGIGDALSGTGISMRRVEIPFELTDDEMRIGDSKARGAGVGILANGRIDRRAEQIELEGEIAPFKVINGLLGIIPLIGPIITGGGDGILAATFTVDGPLEDPNPLVNPLSLFAPGIFRRAFSGFGSGGGTDDGSSEQPTPAPVSE